MFLLIFQFQYRFLNNNNRWPSIAKALKFESDEDSKLKKRTSVRDLEKFDKSHQIPKFKSHGTSLHITTNDCNDIVIDYEKMFEGTLAINGKNFDFTRQGAESLDRFLRSAPICQKKRNKVLNFIFNFANAEENQNAVEMTNLVLGFYNQAKNQASLRGDSAICNDSFKRTMKITDPRTSILPEDPTVDRSAIELMQGKLSKEVMKTITDQNEGLFPKPKEISLECSCPDSAYMCKHVAAAMYGVGSRLDKEPELLFKLRNADHMELITKASIKTSGKGISKSKALEGQDLSNLFGIDLGSDESPSGRIDSGLPKGSKKANGAIGLMATIRKRAGSGASAVKTKTPKKIKATSGKTRKKVARVPNKEKHIEF